MTSDTPAGVPAFWAVTQAVHRLFQCLDEGQFDVVAGLFASDGVWLRQGRSLTGPQQVLDALNERPARLATRHLVTNLLAEGDDEAQSARYYVTVFASEGGSANEPALLSSPQSILVCEDRLTATGRGWRFTRRTPRLVFKSH